MLTLFFPPTDTGANASAEEADEGTEDGVQKVNNIIHSFQLTEMPMDKAGYKAHVKCTFSDMPYPTMRATAN